MSPFRELCLAASLVPAVAATAGMILPDLDLKFRNEFHTAYISSSSGGIGETRPMLTETFSGRYNLGEWGSIGGYAWTRSALTGQKDELRRRAFDCFEYGADYAYTWNFAKSLGLYSYIDHLWSPSPGWYEHGTALHAILIEQALNNPYATPYYKFLGAYFPNQWETLKLGVRQPYKFLDGRLAATPYVELISGDRRRYKSKYGAEPDETYCSMGPFASEFGLVLTYKIAEHISTRLRLRNWNLLDRSARERERERDEPWHVCWLPAATLAVDITF